MPALHNRTAIGWRIADAAKRRGLLVGELAEAAEVSPSALSYIMNGKTPDPTVRTVMKLARTLGVTTDWLLGMDDDA